MIRSHAVSMVGVLLACAACGAARADEDNSKVMGSINIEANQHGGDLSTVNGSIRVGENAVVGHATTVNGSITLAAHASAGALSTVNGSVRLGEGAHVSSGVSTVNGSVMLERAAEVARDLSNVNGRIHVGAAHVGGHIDTAAGDIDLGPDARIDGGIHVGEDTSWFHIWFWSDDVPRVVIHAGSVIGGTLKFERKVRLYVSDRASIGPIQGATAIKFSGDEPPK